MTRVLNIGHRGAAGDAPENTLIAFDLALRQGADGIEFDVHLSEDGVPVVIHGTRLNRTTSGRGRVGDHPLAALQRLDAGSWFNRRYPAKARPNYVGMKIPTLRQTLAWTSARQCLAFVEIKKGGAHYPGIEAKVLDEISCASMSSLCTIISFDFATLRRLRALDPNISLGLDVTRTAFALWRARLIRAGTVLPYWTFASRRFLRRARKDGVRVVAWGFDQPRRVRANLVEGVDGIITSFPGRLAEILAPQDEVRSTRA